MHVEFILKFVNKKNIYATSFVNKKEIVKRRGRETT